MIAQFTVTSSCETLLSHSSVFLSFEKNKIKNNSTIWTLERENNCAFLSAAAAKVNVLFKAVVDVCYPKGNESVTFSFCSTRWWKRGGVSFIFHTGVTWKDQKCTLDGESKGSAQSPALPLWPSATKADPCYFASRLSSALCQQPTFFSFFKKFSLQINNFTFVPISFVCMGRWRSPVIWEKALPYICWLEVGAKNLFSSCF